VAASKHGGTRGGGELRIIAGQWRSRKIQFPEIADLRPTPNRVRETLFNWLQPWLPGACCLDLFAGSGALSFEALSRGAGEVVLVERNPDAAAALRRNLALLEAANAVLLETDALSLLERGPARAFDIVFLDPPFLLGPGADDLLARCCALLDSRGWLKPQGLVYLEVPAGRAPPLPPGWTLIRSKQAGQVGYHLARYALSGI
jgi:16S rRNA (guanine966-N2)-methyltransferase